MSLTNQKTYQEFINDILETRGRFACEGYHERHHIKPRCLGGTNDEENLIDLYAGEHYEAHKLLAQENPHNQALNYAWAMMATCVGSFSNKRDYKPSAEDYEKAKKIYTDGLSARLKGVEFTEEHKEKISQALKGRKFSDSHRENLSKNHADYSGEKHPMFGKHHSEESRRNMSAGQQNRSDEWRRKQSESHKGIKHTEEWKKMMSERYSGENAPNYGRIMARGKENPNSCVLVCDGVLFYGFRECAQYYGLKSAGNICSFLRGIKPMPQKWRDRGLRWASEVEVDAAK